MTNGRVEVFLFILHPSSFILHPSSFPIVAQEGFEPSASLVLSESGLPNCLPSQCGHYSGRESNLRSPGFGHRPKGGRGRCSRLTYLSAKAEAVGLEPTSGQRRHPFSRRAPHPAGWLPFQSSQFRGPESNQRPPRSERGVTTSSNYPGVIDSGRRTRTSTT